MSCRWTPTGPSPQPRPPPSSPSTPWSSSPRSDPRLGFESRCCVFFHLCRPTWDLGSGADPMKKSSVKLHSKLEYWPIREAESGHVTDLVGQFQRRVKINAGINFYLTVKFDQSQSLKMVTCLMRLVKVHRRVKFYAEVCLKDRLLVLLSLINSTLNTVVKSFIGYRPALLYTTLHYTLNYSKLK